MHSSDGVEFASARPTPTWEAARSAAQLFSSALSRKSGTPLGVDARSSAAHVPGPDYPWKGRGVGRVRSRPVSFWVRPDPAQVDACRLELDDRAAAPDVDVSPM